MNYMSMVSFVKLDSQYAIGKLCCQKREEFFREYFSKIKIVPIFMILESVFQTAGRIAREGKINISGGVIASFRSYDFSRPIFANEDFYIHVELKSENQTGLCFETSIGASLEDMNSIMNKGVLIIARHQGIEAGQLNSSPLDEIQGLISMFKF